MESMSMKNKSATMAMGPGHAKAPAKRAGHSRVAEWRLGRIIGIIAAGRYPNCRTLAAEIEGVSTKTIQRDLNHLRAMRDLPLEYDEQRRGFYFTRPVSEFAPIQLSQGELVALFVAQKALEPLRGTKLQRLVAEGVNRIAKACPEAVTLGWEEMQAAFSVKTSGVVAADVGVFSSLMQAVMNRKEVTFAYHTLKGTRKEARRAQPYHVIQHQNGWYLIAHDLGRGEMRKFALQRMSDLQVLATRFERDAAFDMRAYLSSGFGAWSYGADMRRMQARIHFTGWAARVVPERQWHPTQQIQRLREDGSEIEFRAEVAGLEEITRWVLSHGRHARVLGPPELVRRVREELETVLAAME